MAILKLRKRSGTYRLGAEFPSEQFVQVAVDAHFEAAGFEEDVAYQPDADLACFHQDKREAWCIESKGMTAAPKIDFEALLGQLLIRMGDPDRKYGAALPDHPTYLALMRTIPDRVRAGLNLHWLIVSASGSVRIVLPGETV